MGKLVLFLADGTTIDIRLARERLTIGRRADNDVCLPYPAVSGEHAAVVTILTDSFLEDLGSTNGTLVNGKPVTKHFLRDRDEIDIGRQKLVYVFDESVMLEPDPQLLGRREAQIYGERVEAVLVAPKAQAPSYGERVGPPPVAPKVQAPSNEDVLTAEPAPVPGSMADIAGFVAAEIGASHPRDEAISSRSGSERVRPEPDVPRGPIPVIRVLTGPNAGRELVLDRDEMAVGRVGLQVAAVRRTDADFRLVPLEGGTSPRVNGALVPAEGQSLKAGDLMEIAGVRIEFVLSPRRADG